MAKNVQLIIPMAGLGQRFLNAGYKEPKPLIKVDGLPIIEHVVNLFPGTTDIIFIINELHDKTTNMREILTQICKEAKIIVVPTKLKGPVQVVSKIYDYIKDDAEVIVNYCDFGTKWDYQRFLEENRTKNVEGAIPCYKGFHPHMLGSDNYAFVREKDNYMLEIKEKEPFTNNKMNEYASNGTYYFKSGKIVKKYFDELLANPQYEVRGEYYISVVYNLLVRDGLKVNIFEIDKMLQWGTPYDLEVYNTWSRYFANIIRPQPLILQNPPRTTTILPMAGQGTRFVEQGYTLPKPFLDVNGHPMFVQALKCLPQSDTNIFISLQDHQDYFPRAYTEKQFFNCKFMALDTVTQGQACTCELGITQFNLNLEDPIMITACDNGVYYDPTQYKKLLDDEKNDIIVWSFKNSPTSKNNPDMYAWLEVDEAENIKFISCKKFIYENPLTTPAIIGTMFFRKARYFIEGLHKNYAEHITTNKEFYVDDVLNQNIKAGLVVKNFTVDNYICWGTPNDYKTYLYWREFFDDCQWHPYTIQKDITFNANT